MKRLVAVFAALALLAAVGQAAPFDSKNVAADAKWVVHVDVDAVRDSKVVQNAFTTWPILKDHSGKHFDMIRDKIGVDLRKDLHGVTIYGRDTDKKNGVAIVFATVNQQLLLDKAAKAADHKVTKHGEIDIHSWTANTVRRPTPPPAPSISPTCWSSPQRGRCCCCHRRAGRQVARHYRSQLSVGRPYLCRFNVSGCAMRLPDAPKCPILKQVESFRVALGEHDGKSFYRAKVVMKSPETASQVMAIVNGFKAMGSLRFANDADVLKLVNGLQATARTARSGSSGTPRPPMFGRWRTRWPRKSQST